ncbi:MOSC N-terminal beta barrel domain-containing protein [Knoellia subterranea]|uniref:MOSC domain-containing protein n=1 Tax=Knoellia subterranea KCTC 19937 TaxID=1385521 RepID=A0A0A0JNI9_9MICO|nr:MOSC N-terminal beta barrel domain-containing protein [Knoellia subterranea]KGN37602.1 hypothetical protein N803_14230 [Knoellia subterranea KCTC 19937]
MTLRAPRITRLGLALLKGTRHLDRDEIELDAHGPVGDRTWCLVDRAAARVLRTVDNPRLLRITVRPTDGGFVVTTPEGHSLDAATRDAADGIQAYDYWGRGARIRLQDSDCSAFFSEYLSRDVVLARADRGDVVYADPISIVTTGALRRLEEALTRSGYAVRSPLDARFRATMTLDLEHDPEPGTRLQLGDAVVEVTDPLERCAVIDLDPETGERTNTQLLQRIRTTDGRLPFGVGARVVSAGTLRLG